MNGGQARGLAAEGSDPAEAAASIDYALVLLVGPIILVSLRWRVWLPCLLGALPVLAATLAYHDAAFGSPFSIGYDHQASFEFAQQRSSTFGGSPLTGAWTLWGFGKGAGVLAQAPILIVGLAGLAWKHRRLALACLPWAILLLFHQTPSGGVGQDHRYLIPAIPILGLGLATIWNRVATRNDRKAKIASVALALLTLVSAVLVWANFFAWRGG